MVTRGSPWTSHVANADYGSATAIHWTGSAYLIGTSTGKVLRTTDFTAWAQVAALGVSVSQFAQVGGAIVVVTNTLWSRSTDDGMTWSAASSTPGLSYTCATPSMFLAGRTLAIYTSTDGLSWLPAYTATSGSQFAGNMATDGTLMVAPILSSACVVGTAA
jgi:hypothetical protein